MWNSMNIFTITELYAYRHLTAKLVFKCAKLEPMLPIYAKTYIKIALN